MNRFLALALVVSLPWQAHARDQTPDPGPGSLPAITVTRAEPARLIDRVLASGLMQPVETIQIAPLIEGQPIEALLVDVGDSVAEGQVLARLSRTSLELQRSQLQASVAAARATVAQAEAQVLEAEAAADEAGRTRERVDSLGARGNASQSAIDQARTAQIGADARVTVARQSLQAAIAQRAAADAQLANVELNLTRTDVTAPVAGEVTARNAQVGAIASAAGQPMFTLMRDGALELRAELAERDLRRVAPGQMAMLRSTGLDEPAPGSVRLVEPTVDPATRLGAARIALDMPGPLRPGMFAEAEILIAEREGLALPVSAISSDKGGARVMVVDDQGRVALRPVTTGIRHEGLVEILSGLTPGEMVVAKAGAFVRPGDHVRPVPARN